MTARMLGGALSWLDHSFAVFPLKPRTKVPLGELVPRGFLDASKDPTAIQDWWRHSPTAMGPPWDGGLGRISGIVSLMANARQGERNRIAFWALPRWSATG